jgi:hypothetical protein
MYTRQVTELQDLIEKPVEREWLEHKSWIDLKDKSSPARASIARHIAAIANYGGGYLVFGFNDDGTRCATNSHVRKHYSHDVIAGIIDRYLQPKFQCEVAFESLGGIEHAIVWIPSHGPSPVISKTDGPHDAKGQPQGIRSGTIYIRSPKPESVPITSPEQWDKLIQRCVLARRDQLVSMFSSIVSGGMPTPKVEQDNERKKLDDWHRATQNAFRQEIAKMEPKIRPSPDQNFVQFSYMVRSASGGQIPASEALRVAEKVNNAVRDTVRYGWSMFHPFTRPEISPRFMTDPSVDGGQTEFLQTSLVEKNRTSHHFDVWRISLDGRASLIRNFNEDRFSKRPDEIGEGEKWFDPWLHVRDITEIVRHARAMSEEFTDVEEICFQIEWMGLKLRKPATLNTERHVSGHACQSDQRIVFSCFPQAEVIGNLPIVVSRLYAPVHRMFDAGSNISPEWVSGHMPGFIVHGL